jgi:hypothetical protein
VSSSAFYDAGPLKLLATNLFRGSGYNFYRVENQLRDDDERVRSQAAELLGVAMESVRKAEAQPKHFSAPGRQKPWVSAAPVPRLHLLATEITTLAELIQQQPVPEDDRMTQRYRQEAPTLKALIHYDEQLVGQCDLLRSMVAGKDGASILANLSDLEIGLEAIRATLQSREAVLLDRAL